MPSLTEQTWSEAIFSQSGRGMQIARPHACFQSKRRRGQLCQSFTFLNRCPSSSLRSCSWVPTARQTGRTNMVTLYESCMLLGPRLPLLLRQELPLWRKPGPNATESGSGKELCPSKWVEDLVGVTCPACPPSSLIEFHIRIA